MFEFLTKHSNEIQKALVTHLQLTLIAVLLSMIIGIPLGIAAAKNKVVKKVVFGIINGLQAIPSLALLGVFIPFVGIGVVPAIMMVFVYSILPIVKNTTVGIEQIPKATEEAAASLGLTAFQKLIRIELPQAFPIIITGIRLTTVSAVGLVTIAAFVGAGGLGFLVYSGIQTIDNTLILAGAIPAACLALVLDGLIGLYERSIRRDKTNKAKLLRRAMLVGLATLAAFQTAFQFGMFKNKDMTIRLASKQFTESRILSEIMKRLIEQDTNLTVEYKDSLGATSVAFEGIKSGSVDVYTEYTGTLYQEILKEQIIKDDTADSVFEKTKAEMQSRYQIDVFNSIGFNNTYAIGVREDVALQYQLKTISDLQKQAGNLDMMMTLEFYNRQDGFTGLAQAYHLNFNKVTQGNDAIRYQALASNQVQVVDAYSTDAAVIEYNIRLLEDDLKYFPPYQAVPIATSSVIQKHPELQNVIEKMHNLLNDQQMADLNYRVLHDNKTPHDVAEAFLKERKMI